MTDNLFATLLDAIDAALDAPMSPTVRTRVGRSVRQRFHGDRMYIGRSPRRAPDLIALRDSCICRDYMGGIGAGNIAQQYGVTRQRVYQIVHANRQGVTR